MKKILSVLMAVVLLVSLFALPVTAAPTATKKEAPKRAIAIVFDNSGSMYMPDGGDNSFCYAWCRATYAMEAFATMMNEKDVMQIYPMWPIKAEVDGETVTRTSTNPLRVTKANAQTIETIFTPNASTTPLSTITDAFNGLSKMSAEEKWLIVLTDGITFNKDENAPAYTESESKEKVQTELNKCVKKVNVAFLGIGAKALVPEAKSGKYQFIADKANSSTQVLEKLSSMCNTIFGRETLSGNFVADGNKIIKPDVSMSKLIVFVQGKNIDNVKLTNTSTNITGVETGEKKPASNQSLKYGGLGCGKTYKGPANKGDKFCEWKIDDSLQGKLLTFTSDQGVLPAGEYELDFSGEATSIDYYYEPDVKLQVKLLDENGVEVDPNSKLTEGKYSFQYALVDGVSQQPTESSLLGKTHYKFTVKGQEFTFDKSGTLGPVEVKANDSLEMTYEVTYLDGYTLSGDSTDFGWPDGGVKFYEKLGDLKAAISGGAKEYALSKLESGASFTVNFTYNGEACSEKILTSLEKNFNVNFDGKKIAHEFKREGENFIITLKYAAEGPLKTDIGRFKLTASSQYINENGDASNQAGATAEFSIKDDSRTLEMSVVRGQSYYQISEIPNSEPITIKLSYSGAPLTEEEMKKTKITYEPSSLKLILEYDYKNSKVYARLDSKNPPEADDYDVEFTASGTNEIGREQHVTKKTTFEVGTLPLWLKILLPILIILLIIALIVWWMTRKRLPKKIVVSNSEFKVGFGMVTGAPTVKFQGKGKKKGKLVVSSPNAPTDSTAKQSITMQLIALSPRYTPSKKRKMACTAFMVTNAAQVKSVTLRNTEFSRDKKTGKFVLSSSGNPPTKPTDLGYGPSVNISAKTSRSSVSFECKLAAK